MFTSVLLEVGDFYKDLQQAFISADDDEVLRIASCKALCNLALEFQRPLIKDENFLKKLVELTKSENPEVKLVCCFTLKNIMFKCPQDVKEVILQFMPFIRIYNLATEEEKEDRPKLSQNEVTVKQQALMMFRSLLYPGEAEISSVLGECP